MQQTNEYYGTETQKAIANFGIGQLHLDFIKAFGEVKKAALMAIQEYNRHFKPEVFAVLMNVLDRIIGGDGYELFPLPLKQGGAGTSINMNFNEVISRLTAELMQKENGESVFLDPIEDINLYQSTNDLLPTAVTVMIYRHLLTVEQAVIELQETLVALEKRYETIIITGRTEMQSALPITLGQVCGGWAGCIERDRWRLHKLKERIRTVSLGGTAIGTCFSAPRDYVFLAEKNLRIITGLPLCRSQNLVDEISNQDKLAELAGGYSLCAQNLFKITGDLLLYTASFINEIVHPHLQTGSSIMAAKTNPVILEYIRGLSIQIQGEAFKITQYSQNGQLQLNAYLPFITLCFINIYTDITLAIQALIHKFFKGMSIQPKMMEKNLINSYTVLNALVPNLGYNEVKRLYQVTEGMNLETFEALKTVILQNTSLTQDQLNDLLNPLKITSYSQ